MSKKSIYNRLGLVLLGLLAVIAILLLFQCYCVFFFDKKPISISSELASNDISVIPQSFDEVSDSWETALYQSDDPDDYIAYTGATFNIEIANRQDTSIDNWTVKFDINNECILNGFWCGEYEVHQFRNNKETVEVVNSSDYDLSSLSLEHNEYTNELMIVLRPGDYLVYLPSEEAGENVIGGGKSVNIGTIFYFSGTPVDLTDNVITYYNCRKFTEGSLFRVIMILSIAWLILAALFTVSAVTYRRTQKNIDTLTQSVINGLSSEYKSLWLINVKKRSIQLVRSMEDEEVNDAVKAAREFSSYDYFMKYYINHYVDESDRERVIREVELDSLSKRVTNDRLYSVYYLHHPKEGTDVYFEMVFSKTIIDGMDYIVMGYRDVDSYVREDMLKKKQLEEALSDAENANRAKSVFLANMSHEIRTPINAVLGMDTMILREAENETIKEYARDIRNAGNTLLAIINDILDFSKIESGKMEIVPVKYRLDTALNDLVNMIRPKMDEKGLEFELNINPEIPADLFGDEVRIKQIIMNLLSNAAKYTRAGKVTWTVDYSPEGEDACVLSVSVKDTGIGIKPEDMQKLFSPYERLELKKNRTVEGTGLGLSIARNLLDKMGSRLDVKSVYGEGSEFSFELRQPVCGEDRIGSNLTECHTDEEAAEKFHAPTARILVVDDVEMNLIVIKNMLKRIEVSPETCMSGREALALARENKYDLIFLDAMMPELSGEETLKLIRAEAELNRTTPIVVLTANAIVGAKDEYIAAGFSDYLSKPIDGELLENMIQKYIPEDKIVLPGPEGFAESENAKEDTGKNADDPQTEMIGSIEEIDITEGIKASGGKDTYLSILRNFYETAESRIKMIRDYYDLKDADNYAIQTHALKSSARLVGAKELSELAFKMEMAGKGSDFVLIEANTGRLLEMYQSLFDKLKKVFESGKEEEKPKKELTEKKLKRILGDLKELVDAYDFEYAKDLFESFKEYRIPESFEKTYTELKGYMAEVDYDSISKEIDRYLTKEG